MNTLTNNIRIATEKAKDVASIRGKPVWCHFASTLTFYIDHIPEWWTAEELARRRKLGEIVDPPHEQTMKTYYYTDGNVRGNCGHHHRTPEAAASCARKDCLGCRSQGGYSDRTVRGSDGSRWAWWDGPNQSKPTVERSDS